MTKIVTGLFEKMSTAQQARAALQADGFEPENIDIRPGEELVKQIRERNAEEGDGFWASVRRFFSIGSSPGSLTEGGLSGISSGDVLVSVESSDGMAERAVEILDQCGAVDLEERAGSNAPAAGDTQPGVTSAQMSRKKTEVTGAEQKIPVVEEELKVGKRAVNKGGVRLRSRIVERPVEQDVNLRDEKVTIDRTRTDRSLGADDGAFQERTVEVYETTEEPVVQKRARVKEEVTVTKESRERKEKVQDTVRGTEVQVEQLSPEEEREFAQYEREFQQDWQTKHARTTGLKYDEVLPGYQYGYQLGRNPQYGSAEWSAIEPRVRNDWEQHGYGPWERFKDAVRTGWERAHHRS